MKLGMFTVILRPFGMHPPHMLLFWCAITIGLNIYLPSEMYYKCIAIDTLFFFPNENVRNRLCSNSNHT